MPKSETSKQLSIDIDKLAHIAEIGVRRAALFMGLGLNAARRDDFNDYELHKLPIVHGQPSLPIELVRSGLPAEQIKLFKAGFAGWIIACGLRELMERYAHFLDKMHEYCLTVLLAAHKAEIVEVEKRHKKFLRGGVAEKLDILAKQFQIAPAYSESVTQLQSARNCLTHSLGIVRSKHCKEGKMILTWRAMDLVARGQASGKTQPLTALMDGRPTEEAVQVEGHMVLRERTFAQGEKLALSQQDLAEICAFFYLHVIPTAQQSFAGFLQANNIPVRIEHAPEATAPN